MDTPPKPDQESSSRAGRFQKLPKWVQLFIVAGGVVVILAAALIVGNKIYYQVSRPSATSSLSSLEQPSPTSTDSGFPFATALASAKFLGQQQCNPTVDPSGNMTTSTLAAMGQDICKMLSEKGASVIQYPLATGSSSYVINGGTGIINDSGRQFLISFLFSSDNDAYEMTLDHATFLENMSAVSALTLIPIQGVLPNSSLLQISGTDVSGNIVQEYFGRTFGRYTDGSFSLPVEKNADGTFFNRVSGGFDTDPAHVSFLTPYVSLGVGQMVSDRDYAMEVQNKMSPVYHKAACGLEESYGDMAFVLGYSGSSMAINFGYEPILHITTAMQGYVPEQWGKVIANVTMADFRKAVLAPKAFNSKAPVEMLTIGGYSVKHVGPFTPDRTCLYYPNETEETYQTIKDGAVVTFAVEQRNDPSSPNDLTPSATQKMIEQVLTSLTFSPR